MSVPRRTPSRGFTLIEIAVVLFIIGVLIAMAAAVTRGVSAAQKRSLTATRIATVETALIQFVMQKRRLPCPADGTLASSANNAGKEVGQTDLAGCTGTQQNGVVPWWTLGITETDATDGWDRRLTYRVQAGLAVLNALDMSQCDPAGGEVGATPRACTGGCSNANLLACTPPSGYLTGRGLRVQNVAGNPLMDPAATPHTGAAWVLISPGETGGGGYLNSGTLAATTGTDGTEELKNYANLALQAYYVDDSQNETAGASHYDDIVSRPSLLSVISKAGLGPRSH